MGDKGAYRIVLFNLTHVVLELLEKSRVIETQVALASAIQNRQSFFFHNVKNPEYVAVTGINSYNRIYKNIEFFHLLIFF